MTRRTLDLRLAQLGLGRHGNEVWCKWCVWRRGRRDGNTTSGGGKGVVYTAGAGWFAGDGRLGWREECQGGGLDDGVDGEGSAELALAGGAVAAVNDDGGEGEGVAEEAA